MATETRTASPMRGAAFHAAARGGAGFSSPSRPISAARFSARDAEAKMAAAREAALEKTVSAQALKIDTLLKEKETDQTLIAALRAQINALDKKVEVLEAEKVTDRASEGARVKAEASRLMTLKLAQQLFAKDCLGSALEKRGPARDELETKVTTLDSDHLTGHDTWVGRWNGSYRPFRINRRNLGEHSCHHGVSGDGTTAMMNRYFAEVHTFMKEQRFLTAASFTEADIWGSYKSVLSDDLLSRYVVAMEPPIPGHGYVGTYIMPTVLPWDVKEFRAICDRFREENKGDLKAIERLAMAQNGERIGLGQIRGELKPHKDMGWNTGVDAPDARTHYRGLNYDQQLKFTLVLKFFLDASPKEAIDLLRIDYQMPYRTELPSEYDFVHYAPSWIWNRQALAKMMWDHFWPARKLVKIEKGDLPAEKHAAFAAHISAAFERVKVEGERKTGSAAPAAGGAGGAV